MPIRVKPLVWTKKPPVLMEAEPGELFALGIGGFYAAEADGTLWDAENGFSWAKHADQSAAKAAAQADHERRVLAMVEEAPRDGE